MLKIVKKLLNEDNIKLLLRATESSSDDNELTTEEKTEITTDVSTVQTSLSASDYQIGNLKKWLKSTGQKPESMNFSLGDFRNYIQNNSAQIETDIQNNSAEIKTVIGNLLEIVRILLDLSSIPYLTFQGVCTNWCCPNSFCEKNLNPEDDPQCYYDDGELIGGLFCTFQWIPDIIAGIVAVNQCLGLMAILNYGISNGTIKVTNDNNCSIIQSKNGNSIKLALINGVQTITVFNQLFIDKVGPQTADPNYFTKKIVSCDQTVAESQGEEYSFGTYQCENIAFIFSLTLLPDDGGENSLAPGFVNEFTC
jgi:hypothetical protein